MQSAIFKQPTFTRKSYRAAAMVVVLCMFTIWLRNFFLLRFSSYGNADLVKFCLILGADPNCSDDDLSYTPIVCASDYADVVHALHQHGANLDILLPGGRTALMELVRLEDEKGVQNLLLEGADINIRDVEGHDLCWYLDNGHEDIWPPSSHNPQIKQNISNLIKRFQQVKGQPNNLSTRPQR